MVPKVNVVIKDFPMSEKTARELLPVKREGNIDISAIVEGSRRLRNKFQEDGYFFAEVTAVCTVTPPTPELGENGTRVHLRDAESGNAEWTQCGDPL